MAEYPAETLGGIIAGRPVVIGLEHVDLFGGVDTLADFQFADASPSLMAGGDAVLWASRVFDLRDFLEVQRVDALRVAAKTDQGDPLGRWLAVMG